MARYVFAPQVEGDLNRDPWSPLIGFALGTAREF